MSLRKWISTVLYGDIIESVRAEARGYRESTERLITQLQEDLIRERGLVAELKAELAEAQKPLYPPEPEIDLANFKPLQRRSLPPSALRRRALEILAEKRAEREQKNAG